MIRCKRVSLVVLLTSLVACGVIVPIPDVGEATGGAFAGATDVTFGTIEDNLFKNSCATTGCHGFNNDAPMSLLKTEAYDNLVCQLSVQAEGYYRVNPGNPQQSYILYKLRGTASEVGGDPDTQMPKDGDPLEAETISALEAWIAAGAPDDSGNMPEACPPIN